jgi:hypothetical protein
MPGTGSASIHMGFEIVDGYGTYRIDGAPSCFACAGSPNLVPRLGGAEGGAIQFRSSISSSNGTSLGDLGNSIKLDAMGYSGGLKYSYPNLLTGGLGAGQYNSNSFFSGIYSRNVGPVPQFPSGNGGRSFIMPGIQNIAPKR